MATSSSHSPSFSLLDFACVISVAGVVVVVTSVHVHWRNWCVQTCHVFILFNFVAGYLNYDRYTDTPHRIKSANGQFYTETVAFRIVYAIISLATFMTLLNTIKYNCFFLLLLILVLQFLRPHLRYIHTYCIWMRIYTETQSIIWGSNWAMGTYT